MISKSVYRITNTAKLYICLISVFCIFPFQCLLVSYYIAVDIQLSILGAVLLFITSKKRKIGIIMVLLSLIVASSVTFAVVYINEYFGHLRLTMR